MMTVVSRELYNIRNLNLLEVCFEEMIWSSYYMCSWLPEGTAVTSYYVEILERSGAVFGVVERSI